MVSTIHLLFSGVEKQKLYHFVGTFFYILPFCVALELIQKNCVL